MPYIRSSLPITQFLDSMKSFSYAEMLHHSRVQLEKLRIEVKEKQTDPGIESEEFKKVFRFFQEIRLFVFFLENQSFSETGDARLFQRFKWIAAKLVKKGEMDEKVLELFE